ncbi:MAG: hypothetical protein L0K82_03515 [Pisciglobus halotolerans]|nr:hypothetical protein [Pisciglobus halotolerans]
MSISFISAIVILVLAVIGLIVGGLTAKKTVSNVMKEANQTMSDVNDEINRFKKNGEVITDKVSDLQQRVNGITQLAEDKQTVFQEVGDQLTNLDQSVTDLQTAASGLGQQFMSSPVKTVKAIAPSLTKYKRTAEKVFEKEKSRY